jgi:glucose/arabinose dehydrogenase
VETVVAGGLAAPTLMAWDPNGRLFVSEQQGTLRVVRNGKLLATPFVSLTVDSSGERGLLGIAFDPAFGTNHYVYVYYTVPANGTVPPHNRVSRFRGDRDVAAPGSEQVILDIDDLDPALTSHNGGSIHFGKDGKLYISTGENNRRAMAQSMTSLLGKILRLNPDGTIPADNPFYATATGQYRAIWALGLRNPYTFAIQGKTGRIFINDVGADSYEEINDGIAGSNYGWAFTQGPTTDPRFRSPFFAYPHTGGPAGPFSGEGIIGGAFYNPAVVSFPRSFVGKYFFTDLGSGWIRTIDPSNANVQLFADDNSVSFPTALEVGRDGALYIVSRGSGSVRRISYAGTPMIATAAPGNGVAGVTDVKITGSYLAGAQSVTFNGKAAAFKVVMDTWIQATLPSGATTGPIEVTTGAGTASTSPGTYPVGLTVTDVDPTSGPSGTPVTITGDGFSSVSRVRFNGKSAAFTVVSPTEIHATVPSGATSGKITVVTSRGGATSEATFTVT